MDRSLEVQWCCNSFSSDRPLEKNRRNGLTKKLEEASGNSEYALKQKELTSRRHYILSCISQKSSIVQFGIIQNYMELLQWVIFFSADNLTLNGPLFLQFLQSYNFSISYNFYLAYGVVFLHHL